MEYKKKFLIYTAIYILVGAFLFTQYHVNITYIVFGGIALAIYEFFSQSKKSAKKIVPPQLKLANVMSILSWIFLLALSIIYFNYTQNIINTLYETSFGKMLKEKMPLPIFEWVDYSFVYGVPLLFSATIAYLIKLSFEAALHDLVALLSSLSNFSVTAYGIYKKSKKKNESFDFIDFLKSQNVNIGSLFNENIRKASIFICAGGLFAVSVTMQADFGLEYLKKTDIQKPIYESTGVDNSEIAYLHKQLESVDKENDLLSKELHDLISKANIIGVGNITARKKEIIERQKQLVQQQDKLNLRILGAKDKIEIRNEAKKAEYLDKIESAKATTKSLAYFLEFGLIFIILIKVLHSPKWYKYNAKAEFVETETTEASHKITIDESVMHGKTTAKASNRQPADNSRTGVRQVVNEAVSKLSPYMPEKVVNVLKEKSIVEKMQNQNPKLEYLGIDEISKIFNLDTSLVWNTDKKHPLTAFLGLFLAQQIASKLLKVEYSSQNAIKDLINQFLKSQNIDCAFSGNDKLVVSTIFEKIDFSKFENKFGIEFLDSKINESDIAEIYESITNKRRQLNKDLSNFVQNLSNVSLSFADVKKQEANDSLGFDNNELQNMTILSLESFVSMFFAKFQCLYKINANKISDYKALNNELRQAIEFFKGNSEKKDILQFSHICNALNISEIDFKPKPQLY